MQRVVTVDIAGQRYPIRSTLDAAYIVELAAYVDQKMRAASETSAAGDRLGLAVLVALNLADEYFRAREQQSTVHGALNERALRLEAIVDEVLSQLPVTQAITAP